MPALKLTKNELRNQQNRLNQLKRYLPTLQLKKALLQAEVMETRHETERLEAELVEKEKVVEEFAPLLAQNLPINIFAYTSVKEIKKRFENIAGCDVPIFEDVSYEALNYDLFDTPVWLDSAIYGLRTLSYTHAEIVVVEERRVILEKELREISIRVNLFEKILIPRCDKNIKTIKVFLGDLMLTAVSQAKVAKKKIEQHKELSRL